MLPSNGRKLRRLLEPVERRHWGQEHRLVELVERAEQRQQVERVQRAVQRAEQGAEQGPEQAPMLRHLVPLPRDAAKTQSLERAKLTKTWGKAHVSKPSFSWSA